ncbi:hypothetical protein HW450_06580 [Corynebacterium hindlerae]|uniref:Uncharacterized protein n=1 Tax=Corynebacterium hindlerae TaxID=699041 RepID=A0A7G5FIB5_9CORY|nr:hypothetical protein [Corynebacterium hindlerae]QMV86356.1 hypothetical protein HW450_06580 [Corynebacterium hindlerae]
MTNFITELKKISPAVQALYNAADSMDNLATLDTWRGNSHEEIRGLLTALADAASITAEALTGDLRDSSHISTNTYLPVLAGSTAALARFYTAAVRDAAEATNPKMLKERFGESSDLNDSWHYYAHVAACAAVGVYPDLSNKLRNAEFRARRKYRAKENYRESALKAEKQVEDLTKENRMLRALIAGHGKKENPQ